MSSDVDIMSTKEIDRRNTVLLHSLSKEKGSIWNRSRSESDYITINNKKEYHREPGTSRLTHSKGISYGDRL